MTLRARLTAAFLAVVLGPVLLGAAFVGAMVTAVDRSRAADRLDHAAGAVRGTLDALCGELRAGALAAGALADRPAVRERPDVAVQVRDADDHPRGTGDRTPPPPWAVCGQSPGAGPYTALAARVELRAAGGALAGYAYAVRPVDATLLDQLTDAAGGATVSTDGDGPYTRAVEVAS